MTIKKVETEADARALVDLIVGLAKYEKLEPPTKEAQDRIIFDATSTRPPFGAFLALDHAQPVGYAVWFETYSTFLGLRTLYLEDLFVVPQVRRVGWGRKLFMSCVHAARTRGCGRMEWQVLDWNDPAHKFYEKIGAKRQNQWVPYRLTSEELANL